MHNFKIYDSQTLCRIFSLHCESFYDCEILKYNMSYMSNLCVSWHKIIRHSFRLPQRNHNFIMSNIRNCVIVCLDRRLCKFIYNLLRHDNLMVKQITEYKMLSPRMA